LNKITFFIPSLGGGGAEKVLVNLANRLVEDNWIVDLIILNNSHSVYHSSLSPRVCVHYLDTNRISRSLLKTMKVLKLLKSELILVFDNDLTVLVLLIRKLFSINIIVISRNINFQSKLRKHSFSIWRKALVMPFYNRIFSSVDYVINQSCAMENDLKEIYPSLRNKTCTIYNPINKAHNLQGDSYLKSLNYLLCVGRLESQKSFDRAIEAFSIVYTHYPGLRLKIVGKGSLESELRRKAATLGVEHLVDFEGFKMNLDEYYFYARALLLTSIYEGFPNVILESLAHGTPVCAFDCPSGPSEIIIDGLNGFLIRNNDLPSFAQGIIKVLNHEFKREVVMKTIDKFGMDLVIEDYKSVFLTLSSKLLNS
jgi:glycosyltransferase involved in cell wall biosynthesis